MWTKYIMPKKGSSKRLGKKTQKMMNTSCMWGGNSAVTGLSGSGATGYGSAIYGPANAQTTNGMGSNAIKMEDPLVVWKGGQHGGNPPGDMGRTMITEGTLTYKTQDNNATPLTITFDENSVIMAENGIVTISPPSTGGSRGGSMLGAAIVPAALLAANQLYKPSRAMGNLSFGRKKGFRKTLKKLTNKKKRY
jgi:hypothetical protein